MRRSNKLTAQASTASRASSYRSWVRGAVTCKSLQTSIFVSNRRKTNVWRVSKRPRRPWILSRLCKSKFLMRIKELQVCEKSLGLFSSLNKMAAETAATMQSFTVVRILGVRLFFDALGGTIYCCYWRYVMLSVITRSQTHFLWYAGGLTVLFRSRECSQS